MLQKKKACESSSHTSRQTIRSRKWHQMTRLSSLLSELQFQHKTVTRWTRSSRIWKKWPSSSSQKWILQNGRFLIRNRKWPKSLRREMLHRTGSKYYLNSEFLIKSEPIGQISGRSGAVGNIQKITFGFQNQLNKSFNKYILNQKKRHPLQSDISEDSVISAKSGGALGWSTDQSASWSPWSTSFSFDRRESSSSNASDEFGNELLMAPTESKFDTIPRFHFGNS